MNVNKVDIYVDVIKIKSNEKKNLVLLLYKFKII